MLSECKIDEQTHMHEKLKLNEQIKLFKTWKFSIFSYYCGSFMLSWIQIRIRNLNADPDPATQINADPNTDPDPKPCGG
jgi:hypothetical protein